MNNEKRPIVVTIDELKQTVAHVVRYAHKEGLEVDECVAASIIFLDAVERKIRTYDQYAYLFNWSHDRMRREMAQIRREVREVIEDSYAGPNG